MKGRRVLTELNSDVAAGSRIIDVASKSVSHVPEPVSSSDRNDILSFTLLPPLSSQPLTGPIQSP